MSVQRNNIIDALYTCSHDCTHADINVIYGKGIFVGLVSYHTYRYKSTVLKAMIHLLTIYSKSKTLSYGSGSKINQCCIPDCWRAFDQRQGNKQDRKLLADLFKLTVM